MKKVLVFFTIIISILIATSFFSEHKIPVGTENVNVPTQKNTLLEVEVGGVILSTKVPTTIYTPNLQPVVQVSNEQITAMSIDGSANVLFDNFYGHFEDKGSRLIFTPNYNLNPGAHNLRIETKLGSFEYSFKIAYFDEIKEIQESRFNK